MKRLRHIIMFLLIAVTALQTAPAVRNDWTDEVFRAAVSFTQVSFGTVDFYEGHETEGADTFHLLPLMPSLSVHCRFSVNPFLSLGADLGLVFENHDSRNLNLSPSLFIYRLYPAFALELHTVSAYFTDESVFSRKDTTSARLECSLLFGYSPGFSDFGISYMPFIGLKPAGVVSVGGAEVILAVKLCVLWGCHYQSPYKVLSFSFDFTLALGWRF